MTKDKEERRGKCPRKVWENKGNSSASEKTEENDNSQSCFSVDRMTVFSGPPTVHIKKSAALVGKVGADLHESCVLKSGMCVSA